jgi:hypothetical protein
MSHQIIASEIFVELSDEQQEILAGGVDYSNLSTSLTTFMAKQSTVETISTSGPMGSTVGGKGMTTEISNSGLNMIKLF